MKQNDIAVIGMKVMGRNLAQNAADHGFQVAVYNRTYEFAKQLAKFPNITPYEHLKDCVNSLKKPRKIILMVKAGEAVDQVIQQLLSLLEPDDIVMDGGNSYFQDTILREVNLKKHHIHFFGVGISGGEEGARRGASIMPGGDKKAYIQIQPILEALAAKTKDGFPCCTYIGENGAGHYVKMVHNGIEYADMQLISEAYLILKYLGNYSNVQIAKQFQTWNQGRLESYLIQITAAIFNEKEQEKDLIDLIKDGAMQKGTGRWSSIEANRLGVDVSLINEACNVRTLSTQFQQRNQARLLYKKELVRQEKEEGMDKLVEEALYAAKMIAYAQGFDLLKQASNAYDWNLSLRNIAQIFQAGCIIQARFLQEIMRAYEKETSHLLLEKQIANQLQQILPSLRTIVAKAVEHGIPLPAFSSAIAYFDLLTSSHIGANLIQAQRDYFGAHTFERIDKEGTFHHQWGEFNE